MDHPMNDSDVTDQPNKQMP
jgi:nucleosome binding factor SPN SPT16 subunit